MSAAQIDVQERNAFLEWRREIAVSFAYYLKLYAAEILLF
jgi:hypothetical protein